MTELMIEPKPEATAPTGTTQWDANFQALHARFPKSNDSILFCLHELQQSDTVSLDDLKALASMHGIRITGASVAAARRLLVPRAPRRRRVVIAAEGDVVAVPAVPAADQAEQRELLPTPLDEVGDTVTEHRGHGRHEVARQPRVLRPDPDQDLGDLVLQAVQQAIGDAEAKAERLRAAVRKAIEVLREAVEQGSGVRQETPR